MNKNKHYFKEFIDILGPDIKKIPLLVLLFIAISVFDLLGIGLIAPFIALISSPETFIQTDVYSLIVSLGFSSDPDDLLMSIGLALVFVFFMKVIGILLINWKIICFCNEQGVRLRLLLMKKYQDLPYIEHTQANSSDYIYKIQTLVTQFSDGILLAILRLISDGFIVIVILIFLAIYNIFALSILVLLIGSVVFLYDRIFRRRAVNYGRLINVNLTRMVQGISEAVNGLKEIRILGKESYFNEIVNSSSIRYAAANARSMMIPLAPRYFLELVLVIFIVILMFLALMSGNGVESMLPTIAMFGVASLRLAPSVNQITNGVMQIRKFRHSVSLISFDLNRKTQKINIEQNAQGVHEVDIFRELELKEVSFCYPETDLLVLNSLSLKIRKGESIGLIGTSGAGKTTLVDLLLGLLEQDEGEILYNGKPLEDNLEEWRSQVAYIPQQILLTDDTLRHNIALGVEDAEIDNKKIAEALQKSHLAQLVEDLPKGFNTMLGENGIRLSGGQRQRIALARAFYHNRDVLVMDEATSALDNETEQEIVDEIKRLKKEKTIIVIAHRMTTVKDCDYIYRIDKGKIIEKGSYSEVVGKDL